VRLWRISNYDNLKGIGGLKSSGRWHNRGALIVYLSESPALAMLEVLAHLDLDFSEIPNDYQLLEVDYSERKGISRLKESYLKDDWVGDIESTRDIGDGWLVGGSSLLLRVPSAIVPRSYNYLFNPKNPLAKEAIIIAARRYPFDLRLLNIS
jgi:RES domain-containing protein